MLMGFLPVANPYIVVATPFLYDYTSGSTSVTSGMDKVGLLMGLQNQLIYFTSVEKFTLACKRYKATLPVVLFADVYPRIAWHA
jgi:hypothetical protein